MPTEEENKASFKRYLEEVFNQGNLEVADEIFDRYVSHQPDGSTLERSPEDVKRFVGEFRSAFPDLRNSADDQIAEGDKVVTRLTAYGKHEADLPGIPRTGNDLKMTAVVIHRIADGKLAEKWSDKDVLGFLQQLDVLPRMEPPA